MSGVDIAGLVGRARAFKPYNHLNDGALVRELTDALLAQAAEVAGARGQIAQLVEDRARFPDKPDGIGRMIEAHIGNLKAGKDAATEHAHRALDRSAEATRQRDEALAALKASEERGERLSQELASARCPHETWQDIASAPDGNVLVTHDGWVSEARYHPEERGWWLANTDPSDAHDGQVYPTRWMHLPDPPKALEDGPAPLADATNNPPSDPGTGQREAGITTHQVWLDRVADRALRLGRRPTRAEILMRASDWAALAPATEGRKS